MENLIYILIGIAWVAYSLYSARQKAIQKQQSSGLPPQGPSQSSPLPIPGNQGGGKNLLDDILRELTGETRPVPQVVENPVKPSVTPKHQKNVSELNQKYEGYSGYKFIQSVNNDFPLNNSGHDWEKQDQPSQTIRNERVSKGFDLREAVIYSELLNRKYF
jgi:hypothetical protein